MAQRQRRHRHRHERAASTQLRVDGFDDAVGLVLDVEMFDADDEVLVFVRRDGRVTRIVVDPLGLEPRLWLPRRRLAEHGDERILDIVLVPEVQEGPPDAALVEAFERLRAICAASGHPLLDLFRTDGDRIQSLSIAVDPHAPWPNPAPPQAA